MRKEHVEVKLCPHRQHDEHRTCACQVTCGMAYIIMGYTVMAYSYGLYTPVYTRLGLYNGLHSQGLQRYGLYTPV